MKRLPILFTAVLLTVGVIALSAFSSDSYHKKALATTCFKFTGTNPSDPAQITNPALWAPQNPITSVCNDGATFCGICFDPLIAPVGDSYALDANGKPNSTVLNEVRLRGLSVLHGQQIFESSVDQKITVYRFTVE